jgi:hypothetical protein
MREHNRPVTKALHRARTALSARQADFARNRPLTQLSTRFAGRFPRATRALHVGGRAVGGLGAIANLFTAGARFTSGDRLGATFAMAGAVGGALLLFTSAPLLVAGGAVLVAGSLVYEFRNEIGDAGRFVTGKLSAGFTSLETGASG